MTDHKRKHSGPVVDGVEQAPSRAMLRAVGFKSDDFKKPQIGIASTWSMVTPCNMHINKLADEAAAGADAAGGKAVIFNTITINTITITINISIIIITNTTITIITITN